MYLLDKFRFGVCLFKCRFAVKSGWSCYSSRNVVGTWGFTCVFRAHLKTAGQKKNNQRIGFGGRFFQSKIRPYKKESHSTHKCRQHVVVDGIWSVMKLILQSSRDGCSADRLGGSQRELLRVKDWGLSRHYTGWGRAGGRRGVRWGGWAAVLTQGRELTLGIRRRAEGQGWGLKVPATTFPPTRHIWKLDFRKQRPYKPQKKLSFAAFF